MPVLKLAVEIFLESWEIRLPTMILPAGFSLIKTLPGVTDPGFT
jgi:hypothetical protein